MLSRINNTVYKSVSWIDKRVRGVIVFMLCLFVVFAQFFVSHRTFDHNVGTTMICGSIAVVLMTLFSMREDKGNVKWNYATTMPLILFGIGIIAVGQIHSIGDGYIVLAADCILVYPAFYYTWANRGDYENLFKPLAVSVLLASFISFVYCWMLAYRGELVLMGLRVAGHKENPNVLGMLGAIIFIACIYLILEFAERSKVVILSFAGVGIAIAYILLSISRAAIMSVAGCLFALTVYTIKTRGDRLLVVNRKVLLGSLLLMVLIVAAGLEMDNINAEAISRKIEKPSQQAPTEQQAASPETGNNQVVIDRLTLGDDANTFSSGRIELWKTYLKHTTALGMNKKQIKDAFPPGTETRAHNNIIDYMFRCGYIVGSFYLIYYVTVGIYGLMILFGRKFRDPKHILMVMMVGANALYALVEISTMPFCRIVPCMYFITVAPIMAGQKDS